MAERVLAVGGVELCVETFGSSRDPAVLLIAGGAQSMVWWEEDWCRLLADGGRFVVRYDHRDTGRSTSSPAGRPSYGAVDLATDPLRILDALGLPAAHLVGLSMGGAIAQVLAVTRPERVRTLTLVSTTPAGPHGEELPGPTPELAATFHASDPEPDWTDRDAVLAYRVEVERPYTGTLGFDEPRFRRLAALEVDRTTSVAASMANHSLVLGDAWPADTDLGGIAAPTLVLHGPADPLFPVEHGRALARLIPGARLVELPGVGHEQPPPQRWDVALPAILGHSAERRR